jgi:hypothetical protein
VKEENIEEPWVLEDEGMERVGEGKHHVERGHIEDLLLPGSQPRRWGRALTLRTVPVAAGVRAARPVSALVTRRRMAAKRGGPAQHEGAEHTLLRRQCMWCSPIKGTMGSFVVVLL